MSQRYEWQRLASAKWADAWEERLRALIGLDRVALATKPSGRFLKLSAWDLNAREARELVESFGGESFPQRHKDWATATARPPRAPLRVAGRLSVVWDTKTHRDETRRFPNRPVLLIPASAAFGTGEHATTSMCLRLLAGAPLPDRFRMLDAGCGSGILAIAGAKLGASRCEAFDFDPIAVRIAKHNAEVNGVSAHVTCKKVDIHRWSPPKPQHDIVCANLFLDLLVQGMPAFAATLKPEGLLIASGIFAVQEPDLTLAMKRNGLRVEHRLKRGRWAAICARHDLRKTSRR
jgi:ribosomal protein L11 methyltransferase